MQYLISGSLFVWTVFFGIAISQRRVKDGLDVTTDKKYAVYLLKTRDSLVETYGWTCGGAIVSSSIVITAAACIDDVEKIYVIAGYRNFVPALQVHENKCTSKMKKRVIMTCVPKDYNLKYNTAEEWARVDIGVLKVDTPFDFRDSAYENYCSYIPVPIRVNYDPKYQVPGTDALIMGWGHTQQYKKDLDINNYNAASLKYAPAKILDKSKCLLHFPLNRSLHPIIRNYMICTLDPGKLNDRGELIKKPNISKGCISYNDKLRGRIGSMCKDILETGQQATAGTKEKEAKEMQRELNIRADYEEVNVSNKDQVKRMPGICQNDHGGPLVTWEGINPILIGIATLYQVDNDSMCMGPSLFTSTYFTRTFLLCVLTMDNETEAGQWCNDAKEQTLEIYQRQIIWDENDNRYGKKEILRERHQVPLNVFNSKIRPTGLN